MATAESASMAERRALLTDREREIVAGEADVSDSYRYQTISRVRKRFERLEGDLVALEKHGDLADELREVICPGYADGYNQLGDELEWEKLQPVSPHDAKRLEYVLETLEDADELSEGLAWETEIVEHGLTLEEILGALGEAKWLLEQSRENASEE